MYLDLLLNLSRVAEETQDVTTGSVAMGLFCDSIYNACSNEHA